ncbi:TPA: hypothetical protein MA058_003515 [Klebsiella pneumoniae]|nr:hypothetical protein [Klebsiella pneumoniae]
MSKCVDCGCIKTEENTNKNKKYKDGFRPRCKECMKLWTKQYEKSVKGYLVRCYRNMESRVSGVQKRKLHLYNGLFILPRKDFYDFSLKSDTYITLLNRYKESGYKPSLAPSIDRIYPWFGYHLENIRWVSHSENSANTRGKEGDKSLHFNPSSIHFVSDLHFLHKNILKYNRNNFCNVDEMNESLVEEWNKVVKQTDLVFNLGDICIGNPIKALPYLQRLNGFIIHLKGNHDNPLMQEKLQPQLLKHLFLDTPYLKININNQDIILCHYPIASWDGMSRGSIHLYGHCHGSFSLQHSMGKSLDVGVDSTFNRIQELRPVSLKEIIEHMSEKEIICFDHHKNFGLDNE